MNKNAIIKANRGHEIFFEDTDLSCTNEWHFANCPCRYVAIRRRYLCIYVHTGKVYLERDFLFFLALSSSPLKLSRGLLPDFGDSVRRHTNVEWLVYACNDADSVPFLDLLIKSPLHRNLEPLCNLIPDY